MKIGFIFLKLLILVCAVSLVPVPAQLRTKDNWLSVRSKNFFLIGSAGEKEMRAVATKLEQFRETFRLLFPKAKFAQTIQTNVVVFKSAPAYLGCGATFPPGSTVITYRPNPDGKVKSGGDLVALEFVPKSFKPEE